MIQTRDKAHQVPVRWLNHIPAHYLPNTLIFVLNLLASSIDALAIMGRQTDWENDQLALCGQVPSSLNEY